MSITPLKVQKDPFDFITAGQHEWTPARANKVFSNLRYEFNRDEKKARQHISGLARMMKSGAWRPGGTIEFARTPDGKMTLVDGHHRMLAQVEAGVNVVWTVLIHDVADQDGVRSLFWTYDTTLRKRSLTNVLAGVNAAEEMDMPKQMAHAVAKAAIFIDNGMRANVGQASRLYTPDEMLRLASMWAEEGRLYAKCIEAAPNAIKLKLRGGQITAAALVTFRADSARAQEFWSGLAEDDGLRKGDPRKTLLDYMRDTHMASTGLSSAACAAARAWNAWVAGNTLNSIRIGRQAIKFTGSKTVVKP